MSLQFMKLERNRVVMRMLHRRFRFMVNREGILHIFQTMGNLVAEDRIINIHMAVVADFYNVVQMVAFKNIRLTLLLFDPDNQLFCNNLVAVDLVDFAAGVNLKL